jgi:hypothetical protein
MNSKSIAISLFLGVFGLGNFLSGCTDVNFGAAQSECEKNGTCTVDPKGVTYNYTVNTNSLALDVLLVVDNSGSMTPNQQDLAARFDSFLNLVQSFDYHVGIVTTNVVDAQFTALSGAKLVPFADGSKFITPQTPNGSQLLQQNIVRPETVICDQYLNSHNDCMGGVDCSDYAKFCPSPDSRAIYAANIVVGRADSDPKWGAFLRPNAPLHIIILSNSDERVCGSKANCPYKLEALDMPSSLISEVTSRFGGGKAMTAHTIIIRPNDSSCLSQQYWSASLFGQYAPLYQQLSQSTGGVDGTICATNYSNQLTQIGQISQSQLLTEISLKCKTTPTDLTYSFNPQPSASITGQLDSTGQVLVFSSPLPPATAVTLHYTCH